MCQDTGRRIARQKAIVKAKQEAKAVVEKSKAIQFKEKQFLKEVDGSFNELINDWVNIHTEWEVKRDIIAKIKENHELLIQCLEDTQSIVNISKHTALKSDDIHEMMRTKIAQTEMMDDFITSIKPISDKERAEWHEENTQVYAPQSVKHEIRSLEKRQAETTCEGMNEYQKAGAEFVQIMIAGANEHSPEKV